MANAQVTEGKGDRHREQTRRKVDGEKRIEMRVPPPPVFCGKECGNG